MQVHHIGYGIKGFYRVAKIGHRWDMNPHAQKRIDILRFWQTHGSAATCDAVKVSRRTLYRWQQTPAQAGGDPAALTPRSRAPKRRRHAVFRREVVDEIRRLRKVHPNLGKLPLSVFIKTWCQTHKCPIPASPLSDASSTVSPIRCATHRSVILAEGGDPVQNFVTRSVTRFPYAM